MYAVVKAGGKQHKVAVGDVVEVNRLEGEAGDEVSLPALLLVDGRNVVSETAALAKIAVTGEIVGHHKGPKIKILKYKNKTGYRRRIGHRQLLTELLVTDIDDGKPKKAAKSDSAKSDTAKSDTAKSDKAAPAKAAAKAETEAPTKVSAKTADKPTKAEPAKAADKPTKASAKTAPAKAADKPTKAEPAKAADKPTKVAKSAKSAKATKATASSKSADTDKKKKD